VSDGVAIPRVISVENVKRVVEPSGWKAVIVNESGGDINRRSPGVE